MHLPVRVLHIDTTVTPAPVLYADVTCIVIDFVLTYFIEVLTTGIEIESRQGVVVVALSYHILLILQDVLRPEVKRQLIAEELGRVADGKVVAVVLVIGENPSCIGRSGRDISLVLLRTCRQSD